MQIVGKQLKNTYTFDNGTIYFYEDLVISEIKEGVHLPAEDLLTFFEFVMENFKTPFGYISHRINSYSIDPKIYSMLPQHSLMKGIAVVSENKFSSLNAHVEKNFYNGRYELFTNIEAAINWLDTILPLEEDHQKSNRNSITSK